MVVKEKKLPAGNFFYLQVIAADFKISDLFRPLILNLQISPNKKQSLNFSVTFKFTTFKE